jgi:hypothetical protein
MSDSNDFVYNDVVRHDDNILYMAYYFPQFHIAPENKLHREQPIHYTDWNILKEHNHSFTPLDYYDLTDPSVIDAQDKYANENRVGAFIFYHYWLDNSMVLNHPVELFMQKKRKTKFMLCWDNESGYLGNQYYDQPEKHAYQLLRYFKNENYLTDINGKKPFTIYLSDDMNITYLVRLCKFLELHDISIKIGHNYFTKNSVLPEWSQMAVEFAPHDIGGPRRSNLSQYNIKSNDIFSSWKTGKEYWQGAITAWDSRARSNSSRTHQAKCDPNKPNGVVSVDAFKSQLKTIKENIHPFNKDKIITLFAWNEWSEGATLEISKEFNDEFIKCL